MISPHSITVLTGSLRPFRHIVNWPSASIEPNEARLFERPQGVQKRPRTAERSPIGCGVVASPGTAIESRPRVRLERLEDRARVGERSTGRKDRRRRFLRAARRRDE